MLLFLRSFSVLVFAIFWGLDLGKSWDGGYFLIYLTRWTLTLQLIYFICATYVSVSALEQLRQHPDDIVNSAIVARGGTQLPVAVQAMWALWSVIAPMCLVISLAYWMAINPFWRLTRVPPLLNMFEHLFNTVLIMIELYYAGNVLYVRHIVCVLSYSILFVVWSVVHFYLKIGVSDYMCGKFHRKGFYCTPCSDCPIYKPLDWHQPQSAIIFVCGLAFIEAIIFLSLSRALLYRNSIDEARTVILESNTELAPACTLRTAASASSQLHTEESQI